MDRDTGRRGLRGEGNRYVLRAWRPALCLVAGALLLLVGGVTGEVHVAVAAEEGPRQPTQKTVFSSKLRLAFFVGLEGTGHHFVGGAFKNMYNDHEDVEQVESCSVGHKIYLPWVMGKSAERYATSREDLRAELRSLVEAEASVGPTGTVVTVQHTSPLQHDRCSGVGELSYPNNIGRDKALAYPDLQILAEVAEEEGVDFRIMYLQRSAKDLLVSNINHRNFHSAMGDDDVASVPEERRFMKYMQIILADAAVVHSGLAELGPGFVQCHFYEKLSDEEQADRIAQFLSPTATVAGYLRDALLQSGHDRGPSSEDLEFEYSEVVERRLQNKLDVLESQNCNPYLG